MKKRNKWNQEEERKKNDSDEEVDEDRAKKQFVRFAFFLIHVTKYNDDYDDDNKTGITWKFTAQNYSILFTI